MIKSLRDDFFMENSKLNTRWGFIKSLKPSLYLQLVSMCFLNFNHKMYYPIFCSSLFQKKMNEITK